MIELDTSDIYYEESSLPSQTHSCYTHPKYSVLYIEITLSTAPHVTVFLKQRIYFY